MSANLSFKDLWLRFAAIKQLHRKECMSKLIQYSRLHYTPTKFLMNIYILPLL